MKDKMTLTYKKRSATKLRVERSAFFSETVIGLTMEVLA